MKGYPSLWKVLSGREIAEKEWEDLVPAAGTGRVLHLIGRLNPGLSLPSRVGEEMKRSAVRTAAINLRLEPLLLAAETTLLASGIRHAVIKGPLLSMLLYGDPMLRPARDIDILVEEGARAEAEKALVSAGFQRDKHHPEILVSDGGEVDLHDSWVNAERVPSRALAFKAPRGWMERLERSSFSGLDIPVLAPGDDFLYLSAHLVFHHGLIGPLWILDLDRYLRLRPAAAAAAFEENPRLVRLVLELLKRTTEPPVPRPLIEAARAMPPMGRIESAALDAAVEGRGYPAVRFFLTAAFIEGPAGRLSFIRETALPAPSVLRDVRGPARKKAGFPGLISTHLREGIEGLVWFVRAMTGPRRPV